MRTISPPEDLFDAERRVCPPMPWQQGIEPCKQWSYARSSNQPPKGGHNLQLQPVFD